MAEARRILIVGGIAGLSLAIALRRNGAAATAGVPVTQHSAGRAAAPRLLR